uniref:uncharacterized protein LOC120335422 n=1 Tax=Styela clava TaxID=7725 RepID=UPI00193A9885|nr:uncharacterized protein LOC120335422 [Styela clava]
MFKPTKQPEETCADNQKKYPIVPTEGRKGQIKSMECTTPLEIEPQLDLTKEMHDYNVTWYLNCTELHPKRRPDVYHMMGSKLTISSLDFSIVGIYSCKITYNGHTRHPIAFSLCAKPPTQTSKPTIRCPKLVKAKIGESVKISCNVSVGYSAVSTFAMEGSWQQINRNKTYSCSHAGISTMHGWKEKAQCYSNVSQEHNDRCYLYEPTVREKEPIENILQMTLEIRDIQPDDFGEISVSYTYFEENATDKINLDYQSRIILSGYMYTVIVLSIVVGILLVILLFIMFRRLLNGHHQNHITSIITYHNHCLYS